MNTFGFFYNWIYPGHYLKNLLFKRHDRIKVPQVHPWEWCDCSEMLFYCSFEILRKYVENERPFEIVEFYGEKPVSLKDGRIVGDEIKELYRLYTEVVPDLKNDSNILSDVWFNNVNYEIDFLGDKKDDEEDLHLIDLKCEVNTGDKIKTSPHEEFVIKKYFPYGIPEDLHEVQKKSEMLDEYIEVIKQDMLHRLTDIRNYLWT